MGSFRRSLFGYRRSDVDEALAARDAHLMSLEARLERQRQELVELEGETASLSAMVLEREREIRGLRERLAEANECHQRSIASLDAITARLEELQAQARGQATRIRMKALREAVEVSKRVQALTDAYPEAAPKSGASRADGSADGAASANGAGIRGGAPREERRAASLGPADGGEDSAEGLFEGLVRLDIGPLGDFSQLVGFEDAVGRTGASEISIERFSEGRATLSVRLDEPTELVRELEQLSSLDFKVRHTAPDRLVLDVDEDEAEDRRAA
mgnify:CR=1 FL=1